MKIHIGKTIVNSGLLCSLLLDVLFLRWFFQHLELNLILNIYIYSISTSLEIYSEGKPLRLHMPFQHMLSLLESNRPSDLVLDAMLGICFQEHHHKMQYNQIYQWISIYFVIWDVLHCQWNSYTYIINFLHLFNSSV